MSSYSSNPHDAELGASPHFSYASYVFDPAQTITSCPWIDGEISVLLGVGGENLWNNSVNDGVGGKLALIGTWISRRRRIGAVELAADVFVLPFHCHLAMEYVGNDHPFVGVLDGDSDGCGFCSWSDDLESKSANFDVAYGLLDVLADFPDVTQVEDILEVVGWRDWVVVAFLVAPSRMIAWR
jgi:hypothetical protein